MLCRETCVRLWTGPNSEKYVQFLNITPGGSICSHYIFNRDSTLHTGKHSYIDKCFIMYTVALLLIRDEIFPIVLKQLS